MESNQSSNIKKSSQRGYALFELVCTALLLMAVSASCIMEQLGKSVVLPIYKLLDIYPVNTAKMLMPYIRIKELAIGIIIVFSIICIFNIFCKLKDLISGPTKTNWLSWVVTLSGGVFFWYYFILNLVLNNEARHELLGSSRTLRFSHKLWFWIYIISYCRFCFVFRNGFQTCR